MTASLFLPLILGFAAVFQAGLNRYISKSWGLGATIFLNALVLVSSGALAWFISKNFPEKVPEIFRNPGGAFQEFSWWYVIPGICGISLVAGVPLSIGRIGALQTFVILIGAQILASMLWDALAEGRPVTGIRLLGAALAFLAAALVNWKGR